jgi:hypothetical protein
MITQCQRCRHRGGIVDPLGCKACRAIRQPISPSNQILNHSIQNYPKPVSFLSSGVSSESSPTPLNPTITHTQSPHRTMDVPLGEDIDLFPPQSMTDYRSVVGTIGSASSKFRLDLAWELSSLSRQFVTPTIFDTKRANAALQQAQSNRAILKYRRGVENLTMFLDDSLGNLDDGKSQGGRIACLTNKTIFDRYIVP